MSHAKFVKDVRVRPGQVGHDYVRFDNRLNDLVCYLIHFREIVGSIHFEIGKGGLDDLVTEKVGRDANLTASRAYGADNEALFLGCLVRHGGSPNRPTIA